MTTQCEECVFAKWLITKTGRLSPTGEGACTWTKEVRFPASMGFSISRSAAVVKDDVLYLGSMVVRPERGSHEQEKIRPMNAFISRKKGEEFPKHNCAVYQRGEPRRVTNFNDGE